MMIRDKNAGVLLLSATVGNAGEFVRWAATEHGRRLTLIQTDERRVPLEFNWVGDKLLTEHLPQMIAADDAVNRTPALVFCFNRDACWGVAERLKGVTLIDQATRASIETHLANYDLSNGAGIKLKQLLIRGVGVHHAGILPKYKELVEKLFLEKLIPLVICTETLAAGINLPARSVVINTLLHGKPGELRIEAKQQPDGATRIRVSDNGPGIPDEISATLFDPFVTTGGNGKPSPTGHGGSGLGLAVCRRLIENSGGTIVLEPTTPEQQGASFLISLPTVVPVPEPKKAA
ncbi:MAG: hypothetical protein IIA33_10210 [Planctomycetes bacterium]|nr:hypothetical protein [Planctomycetota bacterium]